MFKILVIFLFGLAVYTQVVDLSEVPGLSFDEAWQGLFANRLAFETGFHPLTAMNVYNGAVFHYLLAGAFRVFGTSLFTMRVFFAVLNLTTLLIFAATLVSIKEGAAALWFLLLWALLPLCVHDHRFYVELTSFHGFCLSLVFLGTCLWRKRPVVSWVLVFFGILLGVYTHILFIAVYLGALATALACYPKELFSRRGRVLAGSLALLVLPLLIEMAGGLGKKAPLILAAGLLLTVVYFGLSRTVTAKSRVILGKICGAPSAMWAVAALAYLIEYVLLEWNGNWPYAQATGNLVWLWIPLNAIIFLVLFYRELRKRRVPDWKHALWRFFIFVFLATSVMAFKQSTRYYLVATLIAMLWMSVRLGAIKSMKLQAAIGICFWTWNLFAFEIFYLKSYFKTPPTDHEFHASLFHDNARDFRPFQKVHEWIVMQNCQKTMPALEDDRFARPMEFLGIGEATPSGPCAWGKRKMFLLHLGQTDRNMHVYRHETSWGDLALFSPE